MLELDFGHDKARSREVFPIGGYAPGGYMGRCDGCGKEFIGAKRASQCFDCAIVSFRAAFESIDRAFRIKLWNEAKERGMSDRAAMEHINKARDDALAAAAREGGDVKQAPGEAPQSGPNGATPNPNHPIQGNTEQ